MLVVAASRLLRPDDVVVVGLGLPQMVALLAQQTHAPDVRLLLEIGVHRPEVHGATMGIADPRMWEGATAYTGMLGVLGLMLHGGRVTLGILGALQVDLDGSINSSLVVPRDGPPRRFAGSGGGNDIASLAGRVLVVLEHQSRKFRETVDFVTSPGRRVRGTPRGRLGLPGEGTACIVTDRAVLEVTDDGVLLSAVHPGEEAARVRAETPIPLALPPGGPAVSAPPTEHELTLLRTELDPHGWYTR